MAYLYLNIQSKGSDLVVLGGKGERVVSWVEMGIGQARL